MALVARPVGAQSVPDTRVPVLALQPPATGFDSAQWAGATVLQLTHDFTYARAAESSTKIYIAQDGHGLSVAFIVSQKRALIANQVTNGVGVLNDDNVTIDLYPQGSQGIAYTFTANARGAHYQTSSENSAYFPQWSSWGQKTADGYEVVIHLPFSIMRTGGAATWRAQFERYTVATNAVDVWEYDSRQRYAGDPVYAGSLRGIVTSTGNQIGKTKPRLQIYGLGELAPPGKGGNTSRVGVDLALPVTATSSLLGAFHPDYSNVEIDQQTIAPNAFPRRYYEVRPFFTQAGSNFNYHVGGNSNTPLTLYTSSIPTFSKGYAYSGTKGNFRFGAFDASGYSRADSAQTLNYSVSDSKTAFHINAQRVSVDTPYLHDDTTTLGGTFTDQRSHAYVRAYFGQDRGSRVTEPRAGDYSEVGLGYVTKTTFASLDLQNIGSQFLPVDGYVTQPDIVGYFGAYSQTINFPSKSWLHDMYIDSYLGRYHDHANHLAQTDGGWKVRLDARNLLVFQLSDDRTGIQAYTGEFLPFNATGVLLGYKISTSTPAAISFSHGPYYRGSLFTWSYEASQQIRRNINVRLAALENSYSSPLQAEPLARQWLERASIDWQFSRTASFDLGMRQIIGRNLPNSYQPPHLPVPGKDCGRINGFSPFDCVHATNVSAAFHFLSAHNEFYVVYGDANRIVTTPALIVKWIRYIGATKGT
ncbi:MAG: hypothetical protein M3O31_16565 [Acidobacteriota bacterium]|nr:hypothetical protein [Acidobacteriota bacterium]